MGKKWTMFKLDNEKTRVIFEMICRYPGQNISMLEQKVLGKNAKDGVRRLGGLIKLDYKGLYPIGFTEDGNVRLLYKKLNSGIYRSEKIDKIMTSLVEPKSYESIAMETGVNENTVKYIIQQLRDMKLARREKLEGESTCHYTINYDRIKEIIAHHDKETKRLLTGINKEIKRQIKEDRGNCNIYEKSIFDNEERIREILLTIVYREQWATKKKRIEISICTSPIWNKIFDWGIDPEKLK